MSALCSGHILWKADADHLLPSLIHLALHFCFIVEFSGAMNDRRKKGRETGNGVEQAMSALNLEMHKWSADVDHPLPSLPTSLCTLVLLQNFVGEWQKECNINRT
jgi:hypothetical protein